MIHWRPKKKTIIALSIFLLLILAFFLIRAFSFDIAIWFSGFRPDSVEVMSVGKMMAPGLNNWDDLKIIKAETADGKFGLFMVSKGERGFWSCLATPENAIERGMQRCFWTQDITHTWYTGEPGPIFQENHYIYYGNNAIKQIAFLPEQIPPNVTVNIQQTGSEFTLHVISLADVAIRNDFKVHELLLANGCVEDTPITWAE